MSPVGLLNSPQLRAAVAKDLDGADDQAGFVADGRGRHQNGGSRPVAVADMNFRRDCRGTSQDRGQRATITAEIPALTITMHEPVVTAGTADDFVGLETTKMLGSAVPETDFAISVNKVDAIGDVIENLQQKLRRRSVYCTPAVLIGRDAGFILQ